ncbi:MULTISPECIES: PqqD family protein [unclassified Romboutsia]|uniref:PqqD family protein n=1 Tax=unclassified Romboutsia TaxID=2626894 RepID=UPI0008208577|nr:MULTISPECIES: PqqD family protein [unclassified Romboutsia]SCH19423.1 Uncharacterised protein [uncultured Clostridium sp.]
MINKNEFITRDILGETILVPVGNTVNNFNGLITINKVGRFIWDHADKVKDEDELINLITEKYDIDYETASKDCSEFLDKLRSSNIIK